jgi:hypothetical protein
MAALVVLCATRAGASSSDTTTPADRPLVVLIGTTADDALVGRLGAELHVLGIDIDRRVVSPDDAGVDLLVDAVMRDGARAVVRVQGPSGRIVVSIADPATHALALREVLEGSPTAAASSVLAVRSVEFVRAMLLGEPPPEARVTRPAAPTGPAPPTEPVVPARPPVLGLTLASGVAVAAGGLGAQAEVGGEVRVGLGRYLGLEIVGLAPLTTEAVPGPAPNARATVWLAGGGLYARGGAGRAGSVELGAGALAVGLRVSGASDQTFAGGTQTRVGTAGYGRVGGALTLTRVLAVRADLLVGSVFARPRRPPGGPGYPWGHAFATALVGVEARWF